MQIGIRKKSTFSVDLQIIDPEKLLEKL